MCGRFDLHSPPRYLAALFQARDDDELDEGFRPSWNIAPSATVIGIATGPEGRVLGAYRWGLVPPWAKDRSAGNRAFNARAESAATRPFFRAAFVRRRLVVPADGFYEWSQRPGGARQPHYFTSAPGAPLALAGLWETWRDPVEENVVASCTILTTAAGRDVEAVHDRQPVVLDEDGRARWLDPSCTDRDELVGLLGPSPAGTLLCRAVGRAVGRSDLDGPELIAAIA